MTSSVLDDKKTTAAIPPLLQNDKRQIENETGIISKAEDDSLHKKQIVITQNDTKQSPKNEQETDKPSESSKRKILLSLAVIALLGGAGYYGYGWWSEGRFLVSTDDAYIRADVSVISAKVAGYVMAVPITDNLTVKANDLLAKIDDRDYVLAVDTATNKLLTQQATIARLKDQAVAQNAVIEQAKAQLASANASKLRTQGDFERAQALAQQDFGSKKTLDQARADRDQANANVLASQASIQATEANLLVMQAQVKEAESIQRELQTNIDKAKLDLSFTNIKAPFSGVIGNKAVQIGQYVQPGTRLLSIVPLDTVYIEANYKETQLLHLKPGQEADISVDAAGGRLFKGVVESIAPSSGAQYSLLPPENATGNFTKIVQRVPVRIRIPQDAMSQNIFRPGLSVVIAIHTKEAQHDNNDTVAVVQNK